MWCERFARAFKNNSVRRSLVVAGSAGSASARHLASVRRHSWSSAYTRRRLSCGVALFDGNLSGALSATCDVCFCFYALCWLFACFGRRLPLVWCRLFMYPTVKAYSCIYRCVRISRQQLHSHSDSHSHSAQRQFLCPSCGPIRTLTAPSRALFECNSNGQKLKSTQAFYVRQIEENDRYCICVCDFCLPLALSNRPQVAAFNSLYIMFTCCLSVA